MAHTKIKTLFVATTMLAGAAFAISAYANPMVGGAPMYANKNIVQNAVNSKVNTTLVAAVKAAGLVPTLEGAGPFTVFAPTNAAFKKLPDGTVQNLLKPENIDQLKAILTYHVVAGKITAKELQRMIKEGGGKATLKTVEGGELTAEDHGSHIELLGAKGSHATIEIPNVEQSNGVIHVINGVLLPS